MLVRLTVACALVCGLIGVEVAGPAAAAGGSRNFLKGRTAQKHPVKLARKGRKVKMIRFVAKLHCSDGTILTDYESGFLPTPVRGGKLRDHQIGSTDDVFIRAKLKGRRVRGRLRVKDKLRHGKVRCDSHWLKFSAHPAG